MDVGIVGFPGAGRTTVFRALLAQRAPSLEGARRSEIGTIRVHDERLVRLAERFCPKKVTPIEIRVHDLCSSLEASFPTSEVEAMKRMEALLLVLPGFQDPSPDHSRRELARLTSELCLQDLTIVERRLERVKKEPLDERTREALEEARGILETEQPIRGAALDPAHREALRAYGLVTDRPWVCIQNVGEAAAGTPVPDELQAKGERLDCPVLALCASLEAEAAELESPEREEFLQAYGIGEPGGVAATRLLLASGDRIPFFTVSEDECRAWSIPRGTPARKAAGRVHSDIERGFIRAEVLPFAEWAALPGGLAEARKLGRLRVEGQAYILQDGDIVNFRFNV